MSLKYTIKNWMLRKYKNKEISYDERKKLQVDILREVDTFCRTHDIRYCLAYGTLLGAVRHKGYIPWDDDIDIHMPYPDMIKFKNEFKSDKYMYVDADNYKHFTFFFSRVIDKRTFTTGLFAFKKHDYGVCIDLYPVLGLPKSSKDTDAFIQELALWNKKECRVHSLQNRFNGRMPFSIYPLDRIIEEGRNLYFKYPYEGATKWFGGAATPYYDKVFDFDMFDNPIDMNFEDYRFLVPKEYDKYLTLNYGNYMQLPPEEKRVPAHPRICYWK